jgi:hypothetical protein
MKRIKMSRARFGSPKGQPAIILYAQRCEKMGILADRASWSNPVLIGRPYKPSGRCSITEVEYSL